MGTPIPRRNVAVPIDGSGTASAADITSARGSRQVRCLSRAAGRSASVDAMRCLVGMLLCIAVDGPSHRVRMMLRAEGGVSIAVQALAARSIRFF